MNNQDVYSSDDEVFVGNLSLKEIKKQFKIETHRQTLPCAPTITIENCDTSLKLVETKSEPDIASVISPRVKPTGDYCGTADEMEDDSFLKIEKLVSEMQMSPSSNQKEDLDNNVNLDEAVDLILKQGITSQSSNNNLTKLNANQILCEESNKKDNDNNIIIPTSPASRYCTPMKHLYSHENVKTPITKTKLKTPFFKTPANPVSIKKTSSISIKKTPSKSYQHIASPIAAYIKNSPQVPLVNHILPKKPMPGVSSIPKLLKPKLQTFNKENINLPTLAYKTAKTVQVIQVSERDKLPQSHWAKKVTSTIPKSLVLKHNHREIYAAEKPIKCSQEDSFANLTLQQADVSVCTQKSARPK